ncbi:CD48 antigen-like [Gambusia affinis]|uniref:CD48 antigen-like n=1 Tax=Gambusia affinis TaxID=33528 RepID=UPI001CDB6220|nr:CD48 antigen-like [Gambusia affinis]
MRSTLQFILTLSFLFFLEAAIIKFKGENVTFHPNITGFQIHSYSWTFTQNNETEKIIQVTVEEKKIHRTRFKGRLNTDVKTGSITIFNLTLSDGGTFQGLFSNDGGQMSPYIIKLDVKDRDEFIELGFLVGSNVTLRSKLEKLEKDHLISWLFGLPFPEREIGNNKKCPSKHGDIFDKVFLNLTNGDLTIPQITKNFHGKYYCKFWKHGLPCHLRKFDVTVYDQVSVPNITKSAAPPANGVCSVTCSVENGPEVNLTWVRGNVSISHSSNQNASTLKLLHIRAEDSSTYSCEAQNPVSLQRKTLDSQRLTCPNAGTAKLWVGPVITVTILLIVGAGLFIYRKIWKRGRQRSTETSPQNCSSSLTSEEFLLQNCQRPNYETVK